MLSSGWGSPAHMYWNYVRNPWIWNWYGNSYLFANTWIDQNAASYADRPE
jgi:hypothetical protein